MLQGHRQPKKKVYLKDYEDDDLKLIYEEGLLNTGEAKLPYKEDQINRKEIEGLILTAQDQSLIINSYIARIEKTSPSTFYSNKEASLNLQQDPLQARRHGLHTLFRSC